MYGELVKRLRSQCRGYGKECEDCNADGNCRSQMENEAADAIEVLSKKENTTQWVPVTERLPELHEEVLVCNTEYGLSGLGFAMVAVWDGTDWIETWDRKTAIHCVAYWMPLPEPPKEEA